MHPAFEQIEAMLAAALNGLDAQQTQLHPGNRAGKWSTQQIVEHLILTYALTRSTIEARLAKGKPTLAQPNYKQRVMQLVLITCGIFPEGQPAPSVVCPQLNAGSLAGSQILAIVRDQLAAADPVFLQAEALFGDQRAVTHQILGPLNIRQWRRFHLVHARHHAKQILAIRREYHV
jgi:hypothetical protein